MNKYILLADSNEEILKLEVTALKYFYSGSVIAVASWQEVIETINSHGKPELLLADFEIISSDNEALHTFLEKQESIFPILASSDSPDAYNQIKKLPIISGLLNKPLNVDSFTYLVKGVVSGPIETPSHVPIDIKTILDLGCKNFDLYLKLSGVNYVKVISRDDIFSYLDAKKLMGKGVKDLHILSSDAYELLRIWEKDLKFNTMGGTPSQEENVVLALETLESIERIAKGMDWSREVIVSAQQTINSAIQVLNKDVQLTSALKRRFSNRSSKYSIHVGLMCFLNCAFSIQLGWTGESGQVKLVMASMLHDLALEDNYYDSSKEWNARASNSKNRSAETAKYRLHPIKASKLAHTLEVLPPDVDQIILQHHERMDGSGFPRGLIWSRIGHLATLFIMTEEFLGFIDDGEHLETSLKDYLTWGQAYYEEGDFKKIFDGIKEKISAS